MWVRTSCTRNINCLSPDPSLSYLIGTRLIDKIALNISYKYPYTFKIQSHMHGAELCHTTRYYQFHTLFWQSNNKYTTLGVLNYYLEAQYHVFHYSRIYQTYHYIFLIWYNPYQSFNFLITTCYWYIKYMSKLGISKHSESIHIMSISRK